MYSFKLNTIIGHRGCDDCKYDNTIEAFEKAIEYGAEMIEFDVRRTSDGVIVVYHDPDISGEPLRNRSGEYVQAKAAERGLIIPALEELLIKLKGRTRLVMELKETGYEKEAVSLVQEYFSNDDFVVISFNDSSVHEIKKSFPGVTAGLLLGDEYSELKKKIPKFNNISHLIRRYTELFPWERVKKTGADFIAPFYLLLHLGMLKGAKKRNIPVFVWTVDKKSVITSLLQTNSVSGIITNKPKLALELRKNINYK